MSESTRRYLIAKRPSGRVERSDFDLVTEDVPEIADGEALIRVEWISVDPTNRGWLNDTPTYLPVVPIGDPVRAAGLGRCVASRNPAYEEGKLYQGLTGWQEHFVASDAAPLIPMVLAELDRVDPDTWFTARSVLARVAVFAPVGQPVPPVDLDPRVIDAIRAAHHRRGERQIAAETLRNLSDALDQEQAEIGRAHV